MMRQITASEVREGMEIRWEEDGAVITLPVFEVMTADCGRVSFVPESRTPWHVKRDQVVTVLREPQPDELTAFGACVEAAGERFVCTRPKHAYGWKKLGMGDSHIYSWYDITEHGHVTVINADPFASTEPREPRVWDRWADVPEMTPVRVGGSCTLYRKVDGRIERKPWIAWATAAVNENDLNKYSPFTEVLPGA